MKKVLFVATVVKTHIMEFHIPYLKMFQDMGWETAVAARNDYEDPADCKIPFCDTYYDIPFERLPWKAANIKAYRELKAIIDREYFDIIHCHTPVGAMIARLAARDARKRGTKVIYTAHGFHFFKGAPVKNWLMFYPAEWLLAPLTDVLVTINKEDYALAKRKIHAKRIEYVPGVGVDTAKFHVGTVDRAEKRRELSDEIRLQYFVQYEFDRQWKALRSYANAKGVRIIGDVPIYVPLDSADVWANPELFQLDESRHPEQVAGCPPDSFTADGQLWGNPIYDWKKMAQTHYFWWIQRLTAAGKLYDVIRLDHFRGFESYWSVPAGDTTARNGKWVKGPGMDFIRTIQQALPNLEFIAEDLGFITPEVRKLQQDSGYPGMKVLEFAFDSREESDYMPHLYPVDSVCYTGTHDNVTLKQWFDEAAPEDVACAKTYLGLNREEGYIRGMIRGCMGSVSRLCVVLMQDYLELSKEARMNFPGTLSSANWTWRAEKGFDSDALAARIYAATKLYGRVAN